MPEVHKIIVEHGENMTTEEKLLKMLKDSEKAFDTGPIIGDSRELILNLLNNIYSRDLFLDVMGVSVEKREKIFRQIQEVQDEKDKEILDARNS